MWIRDFWNRVLAKFRKEDSVSEPVMELTAQEALDQAQGECETAITLG